MVFVGYALQRAMCWASLWSSFSGGAAALVPHGRIRRFRFPASLGPMGKLLDLLHRMRCCPSRATWSAASPRSPFYYQEPEAHLGQVLSADYMRTAIAKGVSPSPGHVLHHALRNGQLIPLATYAGSLIGVIFTGSFLVETIFDINGIGLLGYTSVVDRDYPVVMAILFLGSLVFLFGNLISDMVGRPRGPLRVKFS